MTVFDWHRFKGGCRTASDRDVLTEKNGIWGFWGTSNGWWNK